MRWSDFPAYSDPLDRIEGAISTLLKADWNDAYQRAGFTGIMSELIACLTAQNAPTIRVACGSPWRGFDSERLLGRQGVKGWDRGIAGDDLYFCVKRRQVKWAAYVLLRAGVPVTSALVDPRNAEYAKHYLPGSEPPTCQSSPDLIDQIRALFR